MSSLITADNIKQENEIDLKIFIEPLENKYKVIDERRKRLRDINRCMRLYKVCKMDVEKEKYLNSLYELKRSYESFVKDTKSKEFLDPTETEIYQEQYKSPTERNEHLKVVKYKRVQLKKLDETKKYNERKHSQMGRKRTKTKNIKGAVKNVTKNTSSSANDKISRTSQWFPAPLIDELLSLFEDYDENEFSVKWYQKVQIMNMECLNKILNKLCENKNMTPSALKIILMLWDGHKVKHEPEDDHKKQRTNLYLNLWRYLLFEINANRFEGCYDFNVDCSYKLLKNLFASTPAYDIYAIDSINNIVNNEKISFLNLMYWPYIDIKISMENLKMRHVNCHHSNFKVVYFKRNIPPSRYAVNNELYFKSEENAELCNLSYIIQYIKKIKDYIKLLNEDTMNYIMTILSVLLNDLLTLEPSKRIHTSTKYFKNIVQYPYYRYLSYDNTKKIKRDESIELRLMEIIYPAVNFEIIECKASSITKHIFETNQNKFNEHAKRLKYSLNITCTLCDISFESLGEVPLIVDHIKSHGAEPNYTCSLCNRIFNVGSLTACGWFHSCIN